MVCETQQVSKAAGFILRLICLSGKWKSVKKKLAKFEILFAQRLLTTFGIALTICKVLSNQMIYISKAYWSANHLVPK